MYRGHTVAVVVPAFNEERLIGRTLRGLPGFVDRVVVVDDGSTDGTDRAAREVERPGLIVIRHSRNEGVGAAVATGYRTCRDLGVDVVVVVGADGQMDPGEMGGLLDAVTRGEADYAKGERFSHPEVARRMPWVRLVGGRVLSFLTRIATGLTHVRDSQCGYTAISHRALALIDLDRLYRRYGYPNDLLSRLALAGCRVVDVPVTPIYGEAVSKLRVRRVVLPLLMILLRSFLRRILRPLPWRTVRPVPLLDHPAEARAGANPGPDPA